MEIVSDDLMSGRVKAFINRLYTKIDTPEELAYRHIIKADAFLMQNYFWEAIDEYNNVLKYDKTNVDAHKGLGLAYKQTGNTQSAVIFFNKAKKMSPFDKTLYYEAGCCYCMDKKFDKAVKEYKKAIKICPGYTEAKLNLALAYEFNNQQSIAIAGYLDIIESNPEHIAAYNALGSLYIKSEMYNDAVKIFKKLLKVKKDYSRAYLGIAIAFDKMNGTGEALRYYKKYIKLQPNCGNLPFITDRITELKKETSPKKRSHLKLVS